MTATTLAALAGAVVVADPDLLPDIPRAKGEACVEPTEVMRRRHMDFLLHHRDRTMREGVRTKKHSLVECLNCHVLPDARGEYPRHTDTKHFCTACHAYSSVRIDCFSCHADRPEAFYRKAATPHADPPTP